MAGGGHGELWIKIPRPYPYYQPKANLKVTLLDSSLRADVVIKASVNTRADQWECSVLRHAGHVTTLSNNSIS